ncbi:MAG: hypothetical protein EAZ27_04435 [Cytophagales bacterium]|nr:MAG: hypothetical protein EAZ27_04435 [Cytophagales bacterium]
MKTKKSILPSGVTQEMVDEWKEEFGKIDLITVVDKDDSSKIYKCVVRRDIPDKTHNQAVKWLTTDLGKSCDILLKGCWLGGDEIIKKNPAFNLDAGSKISERLITSDSEVVKL